MFYIRRPTDFKVPIHPELVDIDLKEGQPIHELARRYCPVCDEPLINHTHAVRVPVGIPSKIPPGAEGSLGVHAQCAGYSFAQVKKLARGHKRLRPDFRPDIGTRLYDITPRQGEAHHPLVEHVCAACERPLIDDGRTVLVPVGMSPQDRADGAWSNAACVAVHLACSGYTEDEVEQLADAQRRA